MIYVLTYWLYYLLLASKVFTSLNCLFEMEFFYMNILQNIVVFISKIQSNALDQVPNPLFRIPLTFLAQRLSSE